MKTVSVETARKLKDTGLVWGGRVYGDLYLVDGVVNVILQDDCTFAEQKERLWLPTLDDLLERLEGWRYGWELRTKVTYKDEDDSFAETFFYSVYIGKNGFLKEQFSSLETPAEAAAKAVLWVLEQEGKP